MTEQAERPAVRKGREGNHWVNERPSAEAVTEWFKTVPLHEGMNHADFIGGITLIQSKAKSEDVVGFDDNGFPQIVERTDLTYIPYPKVDTRIAYFWKLMEEHPDWLGVIESVPADGDAGKGLPPGFYKFAVKGKRPDEVVVFIGCTVRVRVLKRDTAKWRDQMVTGPEGKPVTSRVLEGEDVFDPKEATKIVQTVGRYDVDPHCMSKAETGAIGRALGFAGMLVVPGSGVATAEDIQEAAAPTSQGAAAAPQSAAAGAVLPPTPDGPAEPPTGVEALQAMVVERMAALNEFPDALAAFQTWAKDKNFTKVADLGEPQLRGVVRKLDRALHEARNPEVLG